jgi:probable DNA repair protein
MAKWERALEDVALLDYDGRLLPFSEFLHILAAHAEETVFAVESHGAPVQIMGALEAAGQRFDALWFLGADDASWPLRGRMHPLLPYDVQQRTNMPHATPEADFELSFTVSQSLAAMAPRIVISHAARNKDGEQRPSPLVALIAQDAPWQSSDDWRATLSIPVDDHNPAEMEEITDASGVIEWPREQSAGGSEVLGYQAACPFRAFATKRLAAQPLNRSDWGLTAAGRGNLLHKVMERIWSPEIGHLHTLEDLLSAKRESRLHAIVDGAIAEVFEKEISAFTSSDPWLQAYLHSERQTLCKRIEEWLNEEAKRVPFTVIATEEKLNDVNAGGLKLRLRADRIDEVADYARLLIDYKTGLEVSTADWNPPRPSQPQLPLYAVFGNVEDVRGLLFARLRAGKICFTGKVTDARTQLFADVKGNSALVKDPYTKAERDQWSEALVSLAHEFLRGEAIVHPKDGRKTCEHCPLPGLCRVAERPALLEEDDTEPGDA